MLTGIYRAAGAMEVADRRQEVIANNLAHLNVPGFRKSALAVQTFENALAEWQSENEIGMVETLEEIAIDFSPGTPVHTGRHLDVAVDGDAFFVLEGPEGPLYTRNGGFHISTDGKLVTASGLEVMGAGGPISFPSGTSPGQITIAVDGNISVAGNSAGQLKVVAFEDTSVLEAEGTTVFSAKDGATPNDADVSVLQGFRERSNVSAVHEMIEMIANTRNHEAAERVLKALDNSLHLTTNPQGG